MKRFPGQGGERFPGQSRIDELYTGKYLELADFVIARHQVGREDLSNPLLTVLETKTYNPEQERVLLQSKLDAFKSATSGSIPDTILKTLAVLEDDNGEVYIGADDGDGLPLDITMHSFHGEELAIPAEIRARSLAIFDTHALKRITELPTNLGHLRLENVRLDFLPEFPKGLKNLFISTCGNIEVVGLPDSLDLLIVNRCHIDNAMVLPESLKHLRFERVTFLNETAPVLPASLMEFNITSCNAVQLPDLPGGLSWLFCESNGLRELPKLPPQLVKLYCGENRFSKLPLLPDTLEELGCSNNPDIPELPKLPRTLKYLNCNGTIISDKKKQKLKAWAQKDNVTLYV